MTGVARWANAVHKDARVLLIVNSTPASAGEVRGVLDALQASIASDRVSVIAPRALCAEVIRAGVSSRSVLPCDVDMGYFLQGPRALQWAIRRRADLVVGSEPYAPNNEEVKVEFERYLPPLLGHAQLLTHSLPSDQVFRFSLEDVWRRASRPDAVAAHRAEVEGTLDGLYRLWSSRPGAALPATPRAALDAIGIVAKPSIAPSESVTEAASLACRRLQDALLSDGGYAPPSIRILVDPPGVVPPGGWLAGRIAHIGRPAHVVKGVRLHRARALFHGRVEEPFSALLMSRYVELAAGEAVTAEGRLYAGGVTIGLVQDGNWTSRVDLVDPGAFMAAAVAPRPGKYALVVANCRPGVDHRTAFALRRLGFQRLEK